MLAAAPLPPLAKAPGSGARSFRDPNIELRDIEAEFVDGADEGRASALAGHHQLLRTPQPQVWRKDLSVVAEPAFGFVSDRRTAGVEPFLEAPTLANQVSDDQPASDSPETAGDEVEPHRCEARSRPASGRWTGAASGTRDPSGVFDLEITATSLGPPLDVFAAPDSAGGNDSLGLWKAI